MPRFGLEITVKDAEFQVQVSELNTGHDLRLTRDVADGMVEALRRLVDKIDEHLGAGSRPPESQA
jgi:hypothetical protein